MYNSTCARAKSGDRDLAVRLYAAGHRQATPNPVSTALTSLVQMKTASPQIKTCLIRGTALTFTRFSRPESSGLVLSVARIDVLVDRELKHR